MRVAVIGCGPSSLAAAWAARGLGASVDFYGPGTQSPIRGAVLLHVPIPGITLTHPTGYVKQLVLGGDIDDYGRKVYGEQKVDRTGDPFFKGFHTWDVKETYDQLWAKFMFDKSHPDDVNNGLDIMSLVNQATLNVLIDNYDLVINTAPATDFCVKPEKHKFPSAELDLTWETMVPNQELNTIYYSADPDVPWARSSNIFGSVVTEWLSGRAPVGAHRIWKPIGTDCDCYPDVFRVGRYGAWDNKQWIETAYYTTRERILGV